MISQNDLTKLIKQLTKHYGDLETAIFNLLAKYLKSNDIDDANAVYQWELQHNNLINDFTKNVVDVALNYRNVALEDVKRLMSAAGEQIDTDIRDELVKLTGQEYISGDAQQIVDEQVQLIQHNIDVGLMGLVNRNVPSNPAANVYKQITQNAVFQVTVNGKPLSRAIDDNIYDWVYNGLPTGLVNRKGAKLSLEGYSRLCVQSAVQDTFQKIRMSAMSDYDVTLGLYSQHPASRPACAPIQNKVINLVSSDDPNFNPKYDTIYNHGYGTPAGARGINCHHFISPWIEGVSSKPRDDLVTPEQAIKNGKIQQKQRTYERAIRQAKKQLMMAQQLGDEKGIDHYKKLIAARQKRIREFIKPYRFLYRDYQREQVRAFNNDANEFKPIKLHTPNSNFYSVNKIVNTKAYHDKFTQIKVSKNAQETLYNEARKILAHRNETYYEDLVAIDTKTGKVIAHNRNSKKPLATGFLNKDKTVFDHSKNNIIIMHNHPGSSLPSDTDIKTLHNLNNVTKSVIIGHDGRVYVIDDDNNLKYFTATYQKLYNEAVNQGYNSDKASDLAISNMIKTGKVTLHEY